MTRELLGRKHILNSGEVLLFLLIETYVASETQAHAAQQQIAKSNIKLFAGWAVSFTANR